MQENLLRNNITYFIILSCSGEVRKSLKTKQLSYQIQR